MRKKSSGMPRFKPYGSLYTRLREQDSTAKFESGY